MLPFMGASVWSTVEQPVLAAAGVLFTFNQHLYDTDGIHSTSTNTSRLTIPTAGVGKWAGTFSTRAEATSGDDDITLIWRVNGTSDFGIPKDVSLVQNVPQIIEMSFPPIAFAPGDYIEIYGFIDVNVTFGSTYPDPPTFPYSPDYYDAAWATFWRVGR